MPKECKFSRPLARVFLAQDLGSCEFTSLGVQYLTSFRYIWVALQIETVLPRNSATCLTPSDLSNVLSNLPKTLPELFEKALSNIPDKRYGSRIFEIVAAARRPITTEELRIALNVEPGNSHWNAATIPIDKTRLIVHCGGALLELDEQSDTVDFIHYSAEEHLKTSSAVGSAFAFSASKAEYTMAGICITYLQYEMHDRRLDRAQQTLLVTPEQVATKILLPLSSKKSFASNTTSALAKALTRRQHHDTHGIDINKLLNQFQKQPGYVDDAMALADYVTQHWLHHTELLVFDPDEPVFRLFQKLVNTPPIFLEVPWANSSAMYWSTQNHHFGVLQADLRCLPRPGHDPINSRYGVLHKLGNLSLAVRALLSCFAFDEWLADKMPSFASLLAEGQTKMTKQTRDHLASYLATPIDWAKVDPELQLILAFIIRGSLLEPIDPSSAESLLDIPLCVALNSGWTDCVSLLVQLGASVNFTIKSGSNPTNLARLRDDSSPLQLALRLHNFAAARILLDAGADANSIIMGDGISSPKDNALHWSIRNGLREATILLLDNSARPGIGQHGQTTLGLCVAAMNYELCDWMLSHGEDPNQLHKLDPMISNLGYKRDYPLALAIQNGSKDIVDLLLRCGANINLHVGNGPLYPAVKTDQPEMIKRLLACGATLLSDKDRTPLGFAIELGQHRCALTLLEAGANTEEWFLFEGRKQLKPLQAAIYGNNRAMVQILVTHGAAIQPLGPSYSLMWSEPVRLAVSDACAKHRASPALEVLLEAGAKAILANCLPSSEPLLVAIDAGRMDLANLILSKAQEQQRGPRQMQVLDTAYYRALQKTDIPGSKGITEILDRLRNTGHPYCGGLSEQGLTQGANAAQGAEDAKGPEHFEGMGAAQGSRSGEDDLRVFGSVAPSWNFFEASSARGTPIAGPWPLRPKRQPDQLG